MTVAVFPETLLTTDHLSKSKWSPSSPPHPFYSSFNFHIKYFVLVIISGRFEVLTAVLLRIRSSVMWLCVTGWVVSEVLKDHSMFILQYQVVQECLTLEDEDTMILWNVANHLPDTLSYPTITKFPIATGLLNPLQFNKQHNIVSGALSLNLYIHVWDWTVFSSLLHVYCFYIYTKQRLCYLPRQSAPSILWMD